MADLCENAYDLFLLKSVSKAVGSTGESAWSVCRAAAVESCFFVLHCVAECSVGGCFSWHVTRTCGEHLMLFSE